MSEVVTGEKNCHYITGEHLETIGRQGPVYHSSLCGVEGTIREFDGSRIYLCDEHPRCDRSSPSRPSWSRRAADVTSRREREAPLQRARRLVPR